MRPRGAEDRNRVEWQCRLCCPKEGYVPGSTARFRVSSYHHAEDSCSHGGCSNVFKTLFQALFDERHDEHSDQLFRDELPECERMDNTSFDLTEEYPS